MSIDKFYRKQDGRIAALPADGSQDHLIKPEWQQITETELAEQLKPTAEQVAEDVRGQRDSLLTASDWTQLPDSTADTAAWAAYRQALRDVPQQAVFPESIEWPVAPAA